ncbi:Uroporphyrinogen decarboxylase (URO-D) [Phytophthora infestans]|uniref:Uroporphyrinogen decarboxylase (URO-D) n=1 Tax=Phytophthora infestans TaxID=4787 RepID=A0A833RMD8_PHYIN|nr:Uroporphyrinogen decarboxylase (URO-D) [Phytophthora infestans]
MGGEVATTSIAVAISAAAAAAFIVQRQQKKSKKPSKKDMPFPMTRTPLERVPLDQLPKLKNDLLIRALRGDRTERVPVWCMRQAGRLVANHSYYIILDVRRARARGGSESAASASLPHGRSHHLLGHSGDPASHGHGGHYGAQGRTSATGPDSQARGHRQARPEPQHRGEIGLHAGRSQLGSSKINGEVPLIGFVGAPLTLMCYMVEGSGSRTKALLKTFLYQHPEASHKLLQGITDVCVNFMLAQQRAGAQALQVFETVGAEVLTQDHFYEFVFPYLVQIADRVKAEIPDTPIVCFCKGTQYAYESLWLLMRQIARGRVSLQGNMDSSVIYASTDIIYDEVKKMLKRFGTQKYVANLGHGCFPDMEPAHVDAFIKAVQQISLEMNSR